MKRQEADQSSVATNTQYVTGVKVVTFNSCEDYLDHFLCGDLGYPARKKILEYRGM